MSWYDRAKQTLAALDATLPRDMPFDDRVKAAQAAYPFGQRKYAPYKMWLKAQREYLTRHAPADHHSRRFPLSPLEEAIARAHSTSTESAQP